MGWSVVYAAAAASAAESHEQGKRQANAAEEAANRATIEAQFAWQADALAAANAQALSAAQDAAKKNQELATEQLAKTPDVAVADTGSAPNRLRKVRSAFNIDSSGGAGGVGAIRV